jgi:transposase
MENENILNLNKSVLDDYEEQAIKKLISPPAIPLTIGRIQHTIEEISGRRHKKRVIKQFLKKKLKYSYKRGSSRPIKSSSKKSVIIKGLY